MNAKQYKDLRNAFEKYVAYMYYKCKESIHGEFVPVCQLIGENGRTSLHCNCLTKFSLKTIVDKFVLLFWQINKVDDTCSSYDKCDCFFEYIDINNADYYFDQIAELGGHPNLYKYRRQIDIIICYAALTNCKEVRKNTSSSQVSDGVIAAIDLLMVKTSPDVESIFDTPSGPYIKSSISTLKDKNTKEICFNILKCCEILNSIPMLYTSNPISFSKILFCTIMENSHIAKGLECKLQDKSKKSASISP